jgi:glycosyltransferase involved in cell wall biosynthesis
VKEYAIKYPNLIIPVMHEKNIGSTRNYFSIHHRARGNYICHVDGDDLAFPGKLKKQADFLDKNSGHVVVWHRTETFNDERTLKKVSYGNLEDVVDVLNISQSDLLRYGTMGFHSSVMYKRECILHVPEVKEDILDYYAAVKFLDRGMAANLPDILGGYRYNKRQVTAAKRQFLWITISPIRIAYLNHLKTFSKDYFHSREDIFCNALFNFLVDSKNMRRTALGFLLLALRLFSFSELLKFSNYVQKASKLKVL